MLWTGGSERAGGIGTSRKLSAPAIATPTSRSKRRAYFQLPRLHEPEVRDIGLLQRLRADPLRLGRSEPLRMIHLFDLGGGRDDVTGADNPSEITKRIASRSYQIREEERAIFAQLLVITEPS